MNNTTNRNDTQELAQNQVNNQSRFDYFAERIQDRKVKYRSYLDEIKRNTNIRILYLNINGLRYKINEKIK